MGDQYRPATLHIEPQAIPVIRRELQTSIDKTTQLLGSMWQGASLQQPWLGDPESAATVEYYNVNVMQSADGPFQAARRWLDELGKTDEQLRKTEEAYRRTEGDNAALWGKA